MSAPRRTRRTLACAAAVALAFLLTGLTAKPAFAQKAAETQARALQKKAMDEDYLNVDLDKAADKLKQAISKCGEDKCNANLRALLRRDLATVYSAANKKEDSLATMVEALRIDGTIQLDPNFKTKEIEAIYATAKSGGGKGGGGASKGGGGTPSGDFTHTPAEEQAVRTPLPVYAEYGGSESVSKVVVKYKGFGMSEWKTLELKKMGTGWGGNIPCGDVQQGDVQYYIQGFNSNNDPVATGGDRNNPYKVSINKTISGDPPHLPGQKPLAQCADTGDCPPDFPGCNKKVVAADTDNLKGEGEDCEEDGQCKSGTCKDEKCTAPPADGGGDSGGKLRRFWIGVSASIDLQFISSANNACALNPTTALSLSGTYACVDSSGNNFPASSGSTAAQNNALILNSSASDTVNGGLNPGNPRFLASFDYALNYNMLLGVRFGYVALTYPGSTISAFPPIHLEARYTYVFGKEALATSGFAPMVFLAAGVAPFSSKVSVEAGECENGGGQATGSGATGKCLADPAGPPGAQAQGTAFGVNVSAWRVAGPVFAAPGAGVRWAFSDRAALMLDAKLAFAFGNGFLFDITPELAVQFGF